MIVLSPITLTDASFLPSSVPAVDTAAGERAWAANEAVAMGEERNDGSNVYRAAVAIAADVGNKRPSVDTTRWQRMRTTNRWAPFDQYIGSGQVGRRESVPFTIRAPFVKGISIQGMVGTRLQITVTNGDGGPNLIPPVDTLLRLPEPGWWNYWFGERTQLRAYKIDGIPMNSSTVVKVVVSGAASAFVSIGFLSLGKWVNFGTGKRNYGTKWGGKLSVNNYSKRTEEENGEFSLRPWGSAIDLQLGVYIPTADASYVLQELINMKDKPVAVFATDIPGYNWFTTVGFLSVDLSPDNQQDVVGNAVVKGVI